MRTLLATVRLATLDLPVLGARLVLLLAASGIFGTLYLAAARFTGDYSFAGLGDEAVRKVAHFLVYGLAAVMLARALGRQHLLAWAIAIALSTGEEIRQLWVPSRFASIEDWLVNVAGITTLLVISAALMHGLPGWLVRGRRSWRVLA
jgi:VanZ family protein